MAPQMKSMEKAAARPTDLPYTWWWGIWFRIFKTFDVLLFKLLQIFDVHRPQKSILAIPSLVTRNLTILQALVYNGRQDEVLGYRPRRLLHRILKGLPDVEMFEKIRIQLAVSENQIRTVEASTETRGFIHLQLPWQLPWHSPKMGWPRITPLGVDTLVGNIGLGDYEVVNHPVFFLNESVRYVIISDIDDTIKDSKIAETTSFKSVVSGLFRGHYYTYKPIEGMAELYHSIVEKGGLIIYVTSTPFQLAPFLLKFLKQCGFPEGPVFMRWLGNGRIRHKWRTINRVLSNLRGQQCVLIGDSGEKDLQVYRRVRTNAGFGGNIKKVLIRHVPGSPRPNLNGEGEGCYKEIEELKEHLSFILENP